VNALDQEPWPAGKKPGLETWESPEMREAVAAHDVTKVFRLLQRVGMSQQRIATLTGQSQPEVSAIIHGRKVQAYDVLLRVTDGLGIPRGLAGMSSCCCRGPLTGNEEGTGSVPVECGDDPARPAGDVADDDHDINGGAGVLAIRTQTGFLWVNVTVRPLPDDAIHQLIQEGKTVNVFDLVDLPHSRLPGLDPANARGISVLANIHSIAQITGEDPTPPPVVLLAGVAAPPDATGIPEPTRTPEPV
jgi:transcriptional regulator with XRE-family HTH domain